MERLSIQTTELTRGLALVMWATGVVQGKEYSPGGLGFRLASHRTDESAPLSPVFCDASKLIEGTDEFNLAIRRLVQAQGSMNKQFDYVAPVPNGANALASALATQLGLPLMKLRRSPGRVLTLDGAYPPQARVLLVEDVLTKGGSTKEVIVFVENAGFVVEGVIALIDRQEGGSAMLLEANYCVRWGITLGLLLLQGRMHEYLSTARYREACAYLAKSRVRR